MTYLVTTWTIGVVAAIALFLWCVCDKTTDYSKKHNITDALKVSVALILCAAGSPVTVPVLAAFGIIFLMVIGTEKIGDKIIPTAGRFFTWVQKLPLPNVSISFDKRSQTDSEH